MAVNQAESGIIFGFGYVARLKQSGAVDLSTISSGRIIEREPFNSIDEGVDVLTTDRAFFENIYAKTLRTVGVIGIAVGALAQYKGVRDGDRGFRIGGVVSAGLGALAELGSIYFENKRNQSEIKAETVADLSLKNPVSIFTR